MGASLLLIFGICAALVTHHVTSYFLLICLVLWALVAYIFPYEGKGRTVLFGTAWLAIVAILSWMMYIAIVTIDYLVPVLSGALFRPDIVVSQLGVDTFRSDPLAHLNITTNGFCRAVGMIKALAQKWVALGGGGYDIASVARAWTLAWALMTNREAPEDTPQHFLARHLDAGFGGMKLRDEPYVVTGSRKEAMRQEVDRVITFVRKRAAGTR